MNQDLFDEDPPGLFEEEEPEEASASGSEDDEADDGESAADDGESAADADGQLTIFISHRCVVEPDGSLALRLHKDLSPYGKVYVNTAELGGARFDEEIRESLDKADFVIALISERANDSDWVRYELSQAAGRFQREGRPTIIPVLLGFDVDYSSTRIGASVSGFNPIRVNPADYAGLLGQIQAAIENAPPMLDPSIIGLEGFLVGEFRKNLTRAAALDSLQLRRACETLRRDRLCWVVGDAGVRNHFARTLAVREHDRHAVGGSAKEKGPNVYEVTRALSWSRVDDTLVHGSVIIFTDVTPAALFDEESSRDELKSLKRLASRNYVVMTASEDSYSEIEQEMRNREFGVGAPTVVGHGFYDEGAKVEIYKKLLDFSQSSRDITRRQHQWARHLLEDPEGRETFHAVIRKWSPSDVERFVTRHLRQVRREGDILRLLQRNADLDNEIHTWFVALDDSTRCFVLALAMLPGLRRERFWEKYKLIVERLKGLDASLSLWPLGICRQRAAPYVTAEGQLDFVEGRIDEAVQREVTINFREYLAELVPLIKELSVPPGREPRATKVALEVRRAKAAEGSEVRGALARLVGKAGRQGIEDLRDLIEFWGTDSLLQVREAVAISLEQAAKEQAGAKHALGLLERWCNVASGNQETFYRAAAAASALASIVAAKPAGDTYDTALALLQRLAGGGHTGLKFYVSIALKKAVRRLPLVDRDARISLATLLGMAAHGGKAATKINVADALNVARVANEGAALDIIRAWLAGDDADCRWAAMCSLFIWRRPRDEERAREIAAFLSLDAQTAASVLVEVINEKHDRTPVFWKVFARLAR
ncbi:MAG: toll/interleukin-1 receptor domain-containing protein, partial [Pyrinomonadaceae bacterium]